MFSAANVRVFLWALLAFANYICYTSWQLDYPAVSAPVATTSGNLGNTLPPASGNATPATTPPVAAPTAATPAPLPGMQAPAAALPAAVANAPTVHVVTDVLDLVISLAGGELRQAELLQYRVRKGESAPVRLLNHAPESFYVLQSGLLAASGEAPTHLAIFTSPVNEVRLQPGQNLVQVPLTWTNGAGVTVTKTFSFRPGAYEVGLDYRIENGGMAPWSYQSYAQLLRENVPIERSYFKPDSISFKGPAYFDGSKYQKLPLDKKDSQIDKPVTGGWVAALQNHFVAAIIPHTGTSYQYVLRTQGNQFLLSATGAMQQVAPGASATQSERLFIGPKLQSQLKAAGEELNLFRVADYGMLTVIAQPLFALLEFCHRLVGNWGWAIILATLALKLLFYPLSEASGKSMAKMKALAPRLKNLQETYKDDREKLAKAQMEMYRKEKVNPAAGCLPMLIQLPVFLAFYWVLFESVEMRQAPWMGWITDLSSRDPFFILPVLMAAANFIQFKLNPQVGTDPMQQKIFMMMPLVMSATLAFFPAGLVLYWVTNTVLGILQQWNINRRIAAVAAKTRS